jgi:glycosyltransferase involved in cell wall biosynthesis
MPRREAAMSPRILVLSRASPFGSKGAIRAPLVADVLDAVRARGVDVVVGMSEAFPTTQENHVALPEAITSPPYTARFALAGAPLLARVLAGRVDATWWKQLKMFAPDLVVAINPNTLPFAYPVARALGARLALFALGGIALTSIFHSRGAFLPVLFEFYAPLFAGVDALVSVEDSTALHATTPVGHLPPSRQLHLPIPHRTWATRARDEIEQLAALPPLERGQQRIVWAGRFEKVKRPELFVEIARHLLQDRERFQLVMVGADRSQVPWLDPTVTAGLVMPGLVSTERLEAILQSSDLAVFTAKISVAGTIFREAVAAGVPVAATLDPRDILLYTLLDVERDVVGLDEGDPAAAAAEIRASLDRPDALRARAEAARRHVRSRGESLGDFVDRVAPFLVSLARPGHGA